MHFNRASLRCGVFAMGRRVVIPAIGTLLVLSSLTAQSGTTANRERSQRFDYDWKFVLGNLVNAQSPDYDDTEWRDLDLPHDWSIEGAIALKHTTGGAGGYFPAGIGWYRKTFETPASWSGKRVSVTFEGVYMNAEVFLNGQSLGVHPYGYTSFHYDLTPFLKKAGRNVLAVRVDNSRQINCRWYSGSGIYRHVWLTVTDPVHVAQWGVAIATPEVAPERATVQVTTLVMNETDTPQRVALLTRLTGSDGVAANEQMVDIELPANAEHEVTQEIAVNHPRLWSPEDPNLYQAEISVMQNGNSRDVFRSDFGIRSIAFSADEGFKLNGKRTVLHGGCVHHDNGCLGAAAYDRAEERKVELLKAAGFNAVRTSHNPPSEAFLDACDRLGLLVMDEAFDGWKVSKTPYDYSLYFDEWAQRDVESMVLRDRNHPSIVLWSIGNEIIERKSREAVTTARMLATAVRDIDPTRPVTSGATTWDEDWEIFDPLLAEHDVAGYNYQLHRAESDHERVPSRVIVQTESYPGDAFKSWELVDRHPYIIGDFVWSAIDYLGESGIGRYTYPGEKEGEHWMGDYFPWHGAYCGDIDLVGRRKPISHYRSLLYNDTERLYLAVREPNPEGGEIKLTRWAVWPTWESWTWPGHEGEDLEVEVYSRYPKVRLYLDDVLIGEAPTTREQAFKATFTVPYAAGTLKAVGLEGSDELESAILKTAGAPALIELFPDRSEIVADGQDLSYVSVELADGNGVRQPNAENRLSFKIEGPGEIVGVDNANLKDPDSYVANTRKAWKGRALVVIKSLRRTGEIKLAVSSPGLPNAVTMIQSRK